MCRKTKKGKVKKKKKCLYCRALYDGLYEATHHEVMNCAIEIIFKYSTHSVEAINLPLHSNVHLRILVTLQYWRLSCCLREADKVHEKKKR